MTPQRGGHSASSKAKQYGGEILRLMWSAATPYVRGRLTIALLLIIATSIITAVAPLALKLAIDGLTADPRATSVSVMVLLMVFVVCQWSVRALNELRGLVHAQAERRLYRSLSDSLFNHVMRLPLRYHLERQTGAVNETLTNGLAGYQMVLQTILLSVVPVLVQLTTVAVVLVRLDQTAFTVLFVASLGCYATVFAYWTVRMTDAARAATSAHVEARAIMTDSILNYETVKFFTAEPAVRERFDRALCRMEVEWLRFFSSRTLNGVAISTIFGVFLACTILYGARQVFEMEMGVGDFVLITMYVFQLIAPVETIGLALQQLTQGLAFLEKTVELFREQPEAAEDPQLELASPVCAHSDLGELTFENVSASYRRDRKILRNVSFVLSRGKTTAVVGASGAGKSTLVRLLVKLLEPDEGRILLDGVSFADMAVSRLRQRIAVVPQDIVLFDDTIRYNIGLSRLDASEADIRRAAQVAHLQDFIAHLPEGYETRIGERGVKLSGGEKQRVSIARAALKQARIFVFDEATSSLDSRTEREILASMRELSSGTTTLIIAHRLTTVVHADEILVLEDGAIAERGTHEQLLEIKGRYSALWLAQQSVANNAQVLSEMSA